MKKSKKKGEVSMKNKRFTKQAAIFLALVILIFTVVTLLPVEHNHDGVSDCAVCCIINSAFELLFAAFCSFFVFLPLVLFFFVAFLAKKGNFTPATPITLKVKLSD